MNFRSCIREQAITDKVGLIDQLRGYRFSQEKLMALISEVRYLRSEILNFASPIV